MLRIEDGVWLVAESLNSVAPRNPSTRIERKGLEAAQVFKLSAIELAWAGTRRWLDWPIDSFVYADEGNVSGFIGVGWG